MVELCSLPAIDLGPNYGGGDGDKDDLPQKVPRMHCRTQCPQPCSRPPPTHASARDSQTPAGKSPVGSLLLSPGSWCTKFCCALQESQSCVSSGSSAVGFMATSSKRSYAIPTLRAPVRAANPCWPLPPQEMLKHSSVSVSAECLGPVHRFVWALWVSLAGMGFGSKCEFTPPTILLGLLLCHSTWAISHSCSSAYRFTGVSLTLDVGYLHTAAPAQNGCHLRLGLLNALSVVRVVSSS